MTRKDTSGNTALHIAVLHGNAEAVAAILEVRINIDSYNRDKERPIDIALRLGKHKIKELLREYQAKEEEEVTLSYQILQNVMLLSK